MGKGPDISSFVKVTLQSGKKRRYPVEVYRVDKETSLIVVTASPQEVDEEAICFASWGAVLTARELNKPTKNVIFTLRVEPAFLLIGEEQQHTWLLQFNLIDKEKALTRGGFLPLVQFRNAPGGKHAYEIQKKKCPLSGPVVSLIGKGINSDKLREVAKAAIPRPYWGEVITNAVPLAEAVTRGIDI